MRKGILLSILCLVSVLAVACDSGNAGNGNSCGGSECGGEVASSDPFALYKKNGRKWTHKSVNKIEGQPDSISYMSYEMKDVTDEQGTQVMTMLDKDKKPMAGMKPTETVKKFVVPEAPACGTAGCAPEVKYETIEAAGSKFECMVVEMAGTKSWSSKEFLGLVIKMEGKTSSMELVEWSE